MKPHPLPPGVRRLRGAALALVLPVVLAGCPAPPDAKDDPPAKPAAGGSSGAMPATVGGRQARPIQPTIRDVPETGVEIGWGWHTVEDAAVPTVCVEIALGEERGQTKTMEFQEVTDSYAVMQSMDMSASASVKAMGYKASGKAAFAKSTEVSGMSSTFVLEASVDNGVRFAAPVAARGDGGGVTKARYDEAGRRIAPDTGAIRLTPEALKLAKRSDLTAFHDTCGHSYVSAIYEGAKLTAAITIKAKSQKDKQKVSGSLSGSGWGAEVKTNFSNTATSGTETRDVSMRFFQTGGRGDTIPKDQADLLAKLDELARLAMEAPKPFRIALTPYTALSNWPDKPIIADVSELDQLAGVWGSYVTFHERIETAMERPCLYAVRTADGSYKALTDTDAVTALRKTEDLVLETLRGLRDVAASCTADDAVCRFDEADVLDPYGVGLRLPIPDQNKRWADATATCTTQANGGDAANSDAKLVEINVRQPAKARCAINPVNDGCLTSAEIDGWAKRVGKAAVQVEDADVAKRLVEEPPKLVAKTADGGTENVAYEVTKGGRWVWIEPEHESVLTAWMTAPPPAPPLRSGN